MEKNCAPRNGVGVGGGGGGDWALILSIFFLEVVCKKNVYKVEYEW